MVNKANAVYESDYLKKRHNIEMSKEIGDILEVFVAEILSGIVEMSDDKSSIHHIERYVDEQYKMGYVAKEVMPNLLSISDWETKLYFFSRWILSTTEKFSINEDEEGFVNYFEQYCGKMIIHEHCMKLLKEICLNERNGETSLIIGEYWKNIFNKLLEKDYFYKFPENELVYIFVNYWNIIRVFYPNKHPIDVKNITPFSTFLKKVSIENEKSQIVNLYEFNLSNMDLSNMDLSETYFYGVDFSHSRFNSSILDDIFWNGSNLSYCIFDSASMQCSHLEDCNCNHASFRRADLLSSVVSGADFSYTVLEKTNFMECDADRIIVKGMKIYGSTAFNKTDLRYVDWDGVDISKISISENDVSHFWEVVNYTRNTFLYDAKFKKLENHEIQELLYKDLKASSDTYLQKTVLKTEVPEVFISYSSEEKSLYAVPIYNDLSDMGKKKERKYSVWFDREELRIGDELSPGDKLRQSIESVMKNCKLAIIIFSDTYPQKGWTRYEFERIFQENEQRNLPVLILNVAKNEASLDILEKVRNETPNLTQYRNCRIEKSLEVLVNEADKLLEDTI